MTLKQIAAAIYALPRNQRADRLEQIPEYERWIVAAYMDQLSKRSQNENRRRNMLKMMKLSPVNKPGRPV